MQSIDFMSGKKREKYKKKCPTHCRFAVKKKHRPIHHVKCTDNKYTTRYIRDLQLGYNFLYNICRDITANNLILIVQVQIQDPTLIEHYIQNFPVPVIIYKQITIILFEVNVTFPLYSSTSVNSFRELNEKCLMKNTHLLLSIT